MNRKLFALGMIVLFILLPLAACGAPAGESPSTVVSPTSEPDSSPTSPPATAIPTETSSPTPVPSTATPAYTPTMPPPTEEPTSTPKAALLAVPAVNCCRGRTLAPGQYAVPPWLGIPLAFEVGEGWKVLNEEMALFFQIGRGENVLRNPSQLMAFINATSDTASPETLIDTVQGLDQLTPLAEPVEVSIAGFPGLQLDSVAKPNPDEPGRPADDIPPGIQYLPFFEQYFAPGFIWITSSPEARVRTIALTVADQTLLLYMEAPAAEFDQFAGDAEIILQTMELIGD